MITEVDVLIAGGGWTSFLTSGYALQADSSTGTVNEVAELATIAATLMQLKSSEPTASVGRLSPITRGLRTAASVGE